MKINIKAEFEDVLYIINDVDQMPCILVGVHILPEGNIKYDLSYCGEIYTVFDFETSREKALV